ncbi:hypothetical protein Cgig2_013872 [Carnegiea gigantea]|uniref:Uncharacterized protein n=1 Tax=Carnegiea gigantea TaxID=171969 RepID=A0A9Q1KJP1_9CARY|nr:hypothetical protein Cgig2_013872 [Carnegiea gigantea]
MSQKERSRIFPACIQHCGRQEFSYEGAFFTLTNKTVWSRIDRALHNELWYESHDFIHVHYMSQGLSGHTPIILSFPHYPKPRKLAAEIIILQSITQLCDLLNNKRKALTSIFHIQDQNNERVEAFEEVSKVLSWYYKGLLGRMENYRTHIDLQVMDLGKSLTIE